MRLKFTARVALTCTIMLLIATHGKAMALADCFSCHERVIFQKKVQHEPVADGECFACHSPHVARYKGMLQRQVPSLCFSCHSGFNENLQQAVIHKPVREGECLACHDPHSSDREGLLSAGSSDACFSCHSSLPKQSKFMHAPYAKGQCSACHNAHQSENSALLVKAADSLCYDCHSPQLIKKKHPNFPAEVKNCGTCHSPHGSDRRGLIRNVLHEPFAEGCNDCHVGKGIPVGRDTCLGCHEDVGEQMASSHNHLVKFGENGCTACHSPHAGDDQSLLKGKERYVCSTCHLDTFQRSDGAKFKHITTETCMDCHAPHGSNYPNMANAPINEVCGTCHQAHSMFTHPIGENVFDPRTLQEMTCTSCHKSKGSEHDAHLRADGHEDLCIQCHVQP